MLWRGFFLLVSLDSHICGYREPCHFSYIAEVSTQKWNKRSVGIWDAHLYDWEHSEKFIWACSSGCSCGKWTMSVVKWKPDNRPRMPSSSNCATMEISMCRGKGSLRCKTQSCSAIELLNSWKAAFEPWLPCFSCLLICSNWPTPYQQSQNSWKQDHFFNDQKRRKVGKIKCVPNQLH